MAKSSSFESMQTASLKCRRWGHQWEADNTLVEHDKRGRLYRLVLVCQRKGCTVVREDVLKAATGGTLSRRYLDYPDYYLIEDPKAWGGRREFNRNVQKELLRRMLTSGSKRRNLKAV